MQRTTISTRRSERIRNRIINLFSDVCYIYTYDRHSDGAGGWTEGLGEPRVWRGVTAIPCRLDPTKLYRSEELFGQEKIVNEYMISLPHDVELNADEIVIINDVQFQVRKLVNRQTDRVASRALLVEVL